MLQGRGKVNFTWCSKNKISGSACRWHLKLVELNQILPTRGNLSGTIVPMTPLTDEKMQKIEFEFCLSRITHQRMGRVESECPRSLNKNTQNFTKITQQQAQRSKNYTPVHFFA